MLFSGKRKVWLCFNFRMTSDFSVYKVLPQLSPYLLFYFSFTLISLIYSKFKYILSKVVSTVVVITMVIPVVGAEPAAINMARTFGFYDKIWGLWAMAATFCGMYFLVFEAVFNSFPNDYAEAAEIDGASNFTIMVRIIFPLVRNTFATVMLILFIQRWNDYSAPAIYLPTHPTIANGVFLFASSLDAAKSPVTMKVTGAMLVFIPMLIVFAVFNGRLMGNLTMGGIKG